MSSGVWGGQPDPPRPGQELQAGPQAGPDDILAPVVPRRSAGPRAVLAIVCAVVLAGGGTAASLTLTGGSGGASSPEAAVSALFTAVENADVLGVLDALDPGERAAIEPGLEDISGQLQRLGVLSQSTDLNHLGGLSVKFGPLDMMTQQLNSAVAAVTVAGTSETDSVDPSALPLGPFITGLLGKYGDNLGPASTTTSHDGNEVFGTVEVNGGWYVSIGYSAAINILSGEGASTTPPPSSQALQAQGAASPEQAVQDLFGSVADFDVAGIVSDLPPDEVAALDAYSPDWLPQAEAAMSGLDGKVKVTFENLDLSAQVIDDGTLVKVGRGLSFTATGPGFNFSYANGCATVGVAGTTRVTCQGSSSSNAELGQLLAALPPDVAAVLQRFEGTHPDFGLVTVQENGEWYVSPTRTLLQVVNGLLSEFQPQDLSTVADNANAIGAALGKWVSEHLQGELGGLVQ